MTPEFIRGEAVNLKRRGDGNLDLFILTPNGGVERLRIGMDDPDLFVEDGSFTFSDSHASKNEVRYAN
jgi:hypothetical protein